MIHHDELVEEDVWGGGFVFYDSFTDTDGTLLTVHTPETGQTWQTSNTGRTIKISGNKAVVQTEAGIARDFVEIGAVAKTVTAKMTLAPTGASGIMIRYVDSLNFWLLQVNNNYQRLEFYRCLGGIYTLHNYGAFALAVGTEYDVIATDNLNNMTFSIDGTVVSQLSTTHNTGTAIGMITGTGGHSFDDLAVIDVNLEQP